MVEVPTPDYTEIQENRLSRYQRVQQLMQHFWKRWTREYVGELQNRAKWATDGGSQLTKGAMVQFLKSLAQ